MNYFGRGMCKGISLAAGSGRASRHRLGGTAGRAWPLGTAPPAAGQEFQTQQCPAARGERESWETLPRSASGKLEAGPI